MNHKLIGATLIAVTFFASVSPIFAQSATPLNERQIERRCLVSQKLIEARIENYTKHRDNHKTRYSRVKDRLSKLVAKLTNKGYDTTKLKTDLQILDEKILKFNTDVDAFHKKLEEANDFNCGDSEGAFKSKIQEARALLTIVKDDALDIRDFYKNTIKSDFQALRSTKPSPSPVTQ